MEAERGELEGWRWKEREGKWGGGGELECEDGGWMWERERENRCGSSYFTSSLNSLLTCRSVFYLGTGSRF